MSVEIKKINIHAFRGIPDLELELEKKSLLLRGENGTGKSSIVEAIEFFFTGKISHLEGVQGLSLQRHGPHINFTPDDVNIKITFSPGNLSLSRTLVSAPSPLKQLEDYFQVTQRGTFILRRSQILEFIMSQPAERFRAIGSIIGVDPLDEIEREMMRLCDNLKAKTGFKKGEIDRLITDLSTIIGKDITKVGEVLPTLNKLLRKAKLPLLKSLEEVDKHAEEMLRTIKKADSIDKIRVLTEILDEMKTVPISKDVVEKLNSLSNEIKQLLQKHIRLELSVADLLETGRKVIKEGEWNICPLCEQEIDRKKLMRKIDNRLRTLRDLSEKASEVRRASTTIIERLEAIRDMFDTIVSKIELFPEIVEEKDNLLNNINFLNDFIEQVNLAKDLEGGIPIQEFNQQIDEINKIWNSISVKCTQLLNNIGLTEKEKKVLEVFRLIEQARSKTKDISRINSELKVYQDQYQLAEKIYSTFSETKKTKIQKIYNSIQGDIQGFYSLLHPNDPHKNIKLTVALGRRASTELKIESFGRAGEDPRALISEGHLDSLGLCIFLAFVKKFNEGCSLIVLDDVVSTVDANHRKNICKLLLEKFQEKQLIITTHDGVWYEQLRAFQRAYGMEGNFRNLIIVDWNVDTGPVIRPYKSKWEKIQEKIAAGDKSAGNEGRIYLEWVLEKICEATQAPVPFKSSGRYEAGELLIAAKKRLDDLLNGDRFKMEILKAFQDLESTIIMGNLLSHNNILREKISIEEVNSFCKSVHNLHNVFLCPSCRHFIQYYRNLRIIKCSNPRCKDPIEVRTK